MPRHPVDSHDCPCVRLGDPDGLGVGRDRGRRAGELSRIVTGARSELNEALRRLRRARAAQAGDETRGEAGTDGHDRGDRGDRLAADTSPWAGLLGQGRLEARVLRQDALLEGAQLRGGLEPELVREAPPRVLVDRERIGGTPGLVEHEHQLTREAFPERVLRDEPLELGDESRAVSQPELGFDARLDRKKPALLEPLCLGRRERLVEQVGERVAPPEGETLAQEPSCRGRIGRRERAAPLLQQLLEPVEIELTGLDPERISGRTSLDPVGAEERATPRDVAVERAPGCGRCLFAPDPVDQGVPRHHLVRMEEEKREHGALLRPAERERSAVGANLQRARIANSTR